jgi:NADPH2:quinone reductase
VVNYASGVKDAEETVSEIKSAGGHAVAVAGDVSQANDVTELFAKAVQAFGPIQVVVNSAGIMLRPDESVLVHGAAVGVGSIAVQIAKIPGAGQVITTAGTDERRAYARSIGADVAVDYGKPDWPKAVLEATGGRGVDILLESIGGDIFEQMSAISR